MDERVGELPANVDLGVLGKTMLDAARAARIGVSVTVMDASGPRNVYLSEAAADIFGYTVEELVRMNPMDHIAPEDLPRMQDRLRKRAHGERGQKSYEVTVISKDGRRVPIEVTASDAILGGQAFGSSSITRRSP
jgi:PAS domain S-box-containing protein